MRPHYALRCAQFCSDRRGRPRDGTQWVHLFGRTRWVCDACAEALGRASGIPSSSQLRRIRQRIEARLQISLGEPTPTEDGATPAHPG